MHYLFDLYKRSFLAGLDRRATNLVSHHRDALIARNHGSWKSLSILKKGVGRVATRIIECISSPMRACGMRPLTSAGGLVTSRYVYFDLELVGV